MKKSKAAPVVPKVVEMTPLKERTVPDQEIVVKLKATLYARFLSVLAPGADPALVIADLVRQAVRAEFQRRVMQQIDSDL